MEGKPDRLDLTVALPHGPHAHEAHALLDDLRHLRLDKRGHSAHPRATTSEAMSFAPARPASGTGPCTARCAGPGR